MTDDLDAIVEKFQSPLCIVLVIGSGEPVFRSLDCESEAASRELAAVIDDDSDIVEAYLNGYCELLGLDSPKRLFAAIMAGIQNERLNADVFGIAEDDNFETDRRYVAVYATKK